MNLFDLEAVLTLNSKDYENGLARAEGLATSAGNGISNTIGRIVRLVASYQIGKKIVGFGQDAISAASSFESAFTGVRKTVDATEEEYAQLADWIKEASTKMAASKEDIAATMEIAGQLGIRGVEGLTKFTETMVMLGDTTNLSAEEAAGALARFGNIVGIGAEQSDKIGSVIVDLGNNFATTEQDIVSMATRLAGAGQQFGLSGAEILGFATALSSVGIQAEMGGSAFSKAMIKMQVAAETGYDRVNDLEKKTGYTLRELELLSSNDSKTFKALASSLKMTTKEMNAIIKSGNELKDFADIAGMTSDEFVKLFREDSPAALQAFIQGLGDTESKGQSTIQMLQDMGFTEVRLRDTLTRLAGSGDLVTRSVEMANEAWTENIALVNEATLRYGTTESQAMQTAESFKNLKVAIGEQLTPLYGEFMSFSKIALENMSEGFQSGGAKGLMAAVGKSFSEGLQAILEKLPQALEIGGTLVSALTKGIIDALPAMGAAGTEILTTLLSHLTDKSPEVIPQMVGLISGLISSAQEGISTFLPLIVQLIQAVIPGLINAIPVLIPQLISLFTSTLLALIEQIPTLAPLFIQMMGAIALGLISALPELLSKAPEIIGALFNALVDAAHNIAPELSVLFDALFSGLAGVIATIKTFNFFAGGDFLKILNTIKGFGPAIKGFFTTIPKLLSGAATAAKAFFAVLAANPIAAVIAAIVGLIAIITTLYLTNEDFRNKVNEIWGNIKDFVEKTVENIKEKFGEFKEKITELKNHIKEKFGEIKEKMTELKDHAKEKFSEMKDNVGEKMDAMGQKIGEVWDAILANPVVQAILDYVKNTFENLKNTLFGIWNGIKDEVIGAWELIKNTVLGIVLLLCDLVTGDFENLKNDALNIWGNMWSGIKQFFVGIWEVLVSLFQGFINTFINLFVFLKDGVWKLLVDLKDSVWKLLVDLKDSVWKLLVDFKDAMISLGKKIEKGVEDFFYNLGMWAINSVENLVKGVINWFVKIPENVEKGAEDVANILSSLPQKALQWGKDLIDNFVNGIKSVVGKVGEAISGVAQGIRDFLGFSEPKKGPLSNFHTFAPDMIDLFVKGVKDNQDALQNAVASAFDFENLISSPVVNGELNLNGSASGKRLGSNYYTINVNQPVSTPADMLREIRTEAQYGLMIGEALA